MTSTETTLSSPAEPPRGPAAGAPTALVRARHRDDRGLHGPGRRHDRQHRDSLDPAGRGPAPSARSSGSPPATRSPSAADHRWTARRHPHGRKRLFLIGIGGFTIASALCGFAANPEMLVASRILQGGMAALMVPGRCCRAPTRPSRRTSGARSSGSWRDRRPGRRVRPAARRAAHRVGPVRSGSGGRSSSSTCRWASPR